ncbi:NADH:flavin oxidoreductase/NADH oxidase [Rhodospirillum rubrum]|uniref:NADH:flavin oxidoreductase/NADH oxidase n=1 Tax=Rhodospirillum rubrum (strain ATCC 11170 / ATH 1.1.1 / DSM 467 / LMG 4362 / NCIMB 8255 / S1) TaxID=269796 RepID=Q2RY46_RHORT|nr:NADH:flavin oxidoreductase/NADH oxidase [Rhodospirillum rubrum]ABC20949.1 NADH:flavin oxidoreductase/NADH oxidase [Rhodospirillum rubrum ATCC 11170]AEO46616.1 NADH:flavin oxidoreductase/NADH oxidase [Rhodospirillum rubrum F11]MBK5952507.1 oxidoreductase [Rhodospirillum rubrum]QXG80646.1 NADH:flavin oxidoreductase/NADH oxidase [Rhodospirillum rubrum]
MATSQLFQPITLDGLTLPNRIIIAPMCQYSAKDGRTTGWHTIHLGQLALSGAGMLIIEATAVEPAGRISPADLGLWSDETEHALAETLAQVRAYSTMPIALQIAHAGRKASTAVPWEGGAQIAPDAGGWQTRAPSALPFDPSENPPVALTVADLTELREAFADTARRAARAGIDAIEIHAAHGYLLHEFLSPLSNRRSDAYGGSLENRLRFPLEVFDAVRAAFPAGKPVGVRVSATDWVEGGWSLEETIALAEALKARGCAFIHVSSGALSLDQKIPVGPGYQVPLARAIKAATGLPTIAVGLITEPEQAETILVSGDADMIGLARGILYDPRWPWHAAARLGQKIEAAPQYLRAAPHQAADLFKVV